jgi:hypothetical protein
MLFLVFFPRFSFIGLLLGVAVPFSLAHREREKLRKNTLNLPFFKRTEKKGFEDITMLTASYRIIFSLFFDSLNIFRVLYCFAPIPQPMFFVCVIVAAAPSAYTKHNTLLPLLDYCVCLYAIYP